MPESIRILLSTEDTKRWNTIAQDRQANEEVLKCAMTHHHNESLDVIEATERFWDHLYNVYRLDYTKNHKLHWSRKELRFVLTTSTEEVSDA